MVQFEPRRCFEHIDKLSYEIGPRLAGTTRSQQAAEYIRQQFDEYGLETKTQNFEFVNKISRARAIVAILIGIFLAAPLLNLYLSPAVTLCIVVAGYGIFHELNRLMPKKKDRNIVGTLKPEEDAEKRITLGAHYDSAPCTKGRKWSLTFRATLPGLLAAFLILAILGLFMKSQIWLIAWSALAIPYLFLCTFPFWIYENLVSPGANDNASGISVLLEAARVAFEYQLKSTEIKFVAFGGEEQGLAGSRAFSERSAEPDFLVNLDSVGSGDSLATILGNGVLRRRRTSSQLNDKIGERSKVEGVWAPLSGHDHVPFLKKRISATTLSSVETSGKNKLDNFFEIFFGHPNPRTNRHSYLHSIEDVPERIKLENIEKSGQVILELLEI